MSRAEKRLAKAKAQAEARNKAMMDALAEIKESGLSPDWDAMQNYSRTDTSATAATHYLARQYGKSIVVLYRAPVSGDKAPNNKSHLPTAFVRSSDGVLNKMPGKWVELADKYLRERCAEFTEEAEQEDEGPERKMKLAIAGKFTSRRLFLNKYAEDIRSNMYIGAGDGGEGLPDVAMLDDVDANTRYFGARNGIVDLKHGRMVPADEAGNILVATRAAVDFDAESEGEENWAVRQLFSRMEPDVREAWLDALAYALFGDNRRRLYIGLGPRGTGKTTLISALRGALGDYVSEPPSGVLSRRANSGVGVNTPELAAFTAPARFVLIDEPETKRLDDNLLRQISGGRTMLPYTPKGLPPTASWVTTTTFVFTNDIPSLNALPGSALRERLKTIPYPMLTEEDRDPRLKAVFDGTLDDVDEVRRAREAMLACLVRRAVKQFGKGAPESGSAIQAATEAMADESTGGLAQLVRELKHDGKSKLQFVKVWERFAVLNDEPEGMLERRIGPYSKKGLSQQLVAAVRDHYGRELTKGRSRTGTVFLGWKLEPKVDV